MKQGNQGKETHRNRETKGKKRIETGKPEERNT